MVIYLSKCLKLSRRALEYIHLSSEKQFPEKYIRVEYEN